MSSIPLAKHLGSNDKKVRDRAVEGLAAFLSEDGRPPLGEKDMDKLWKGIFYCYWMSDKPLVQQALSSELAELVLKIRGQHSALAFLRGFWLSIVREWNGIDRLRMDKYYMLVRKFLYASFLLLINLNWDSQACEAYTALLTERAGPLTKDGKSPSSLVYHLADIYIEELQKAVLAAQSPLPVPLIILLQPFIEILAQTPSNIAFNRIKDSLLDPILDSLTLATSTNIRKSPKRFLNDQDYTFLCNHSSSQPTLVPEPPAEVRMSLLKAVFSSASYIDTRDSNRRKLYGIWKAGMSENRDIDHVNSQG